MQFPELTLKPLTQRWFQAFFLSLFFIGSAIADSDVDETLGGLSARLEALEARLDGGQGEGVDDQNPGDRVTSEDLERLREEVRALKDQQPEDLERLKDDVRSLRDSVRKLQQENAALRIQSNDFKRGKKKPSSQISKDDETEDLLKLLEESAPNDMGSDLIKLRQEATEHAEEGAPTLPVGNAEAQYNEAFALYNKKAYKEAERAFKYFIQAYPRDAWLTKAMYWRAKSCMKQGKNKEAQALFASAYKKNRKGPKAPHCLLRVGELFAVQGRANDGCITWLRLETDFPHMSKDMKKELAALKKKYRCEKIK